MLYKTRRCKHQKGECAKGFFCPFYHKSDEKRKVDNKIKKNYKEKTILNKSANTEEIRMNTDSSVSEIKESKKNSENGENRQVSTFSEKAQPRKSNKSESSLFSVNDLAAQIELKDMDFENDFESEEKDDKDDFLSFLRKENLSKLLNLIESGEMTLSDLVNIEEEKLEELTAGCSGKAQVELKRWLLKLDDHLDGEKFMNIFSGYSLKR